MTNETPASSSSSSSPPPLPTKSSVPSSSLSSSSPTEEQLQPFVVEENLEKDISFGYSDDGIADITLTNTSSSVSSSNIDDDENEDTILTNNTNIDTSRNTDDTNYNDNDAAGNKHDDDDSNEIKSAASKNLSSRLCILFRTKLCKIILGIGIVLILISITIIIIIKQSNVKNSHQSSLLEQSTNGRSTTTTSNNKNNNQIKRTYPPTHTATTSIPSDNPSLQPSDVPSTTLSLQPSMIPSLHPTQNPTKEPTKNPTKEPTKNPTKEPTQNPTNKPTTNPTKAPTLQPRTIPSTHRPTDQEPPSPSIGHTNANTNTNTANNNNNTNNNLNGITYFPGNLTTLKVGLLLSEGLDAKLLADSNEFVTYSDGTLSSIKFHGRPDGGATFPDTRNNSNVGGWVYVSNSEMEDLKKGGVGALTFDRDNNLLHYEMVLEETSMNCGGGRTPWDTWVSCEEIEFDGLLYQVDPYGIRKGEVMTLGSNGGRWESFAYDVRNKSKPYFFATEDHNKGTVRRFTPNVIDWDIDPWSMLHGNGTTDYLIVHPNKENNGGTLEWITDIEVARRNARSYYPQSEGIDVYGSTMFIVCKRIYQMFIFNLDTLTYTNQTTKSGLFDGKPDQLQRILHNNGDNKYGDGSSDLLYFTEEGGVDAGVHARDSFGRFYTIFESPTLSDETTGLSFSPDGKYMYIAYQENGKLFSLWRKDGFPFHYQHLDIKYHRSHNG